MSKPKRTTKTKKPKPANPANPWRYSGRLSTFLLAAGLLCGAAVLGACNGSTVDPDVAAHLICLSTCKDGTCEKVDGAWKCVKPEPVDPCAGKTPLCANDHSVDCWEKQGSACVFIKAPTPPPVCPDGQHLEAGVCVPNTPPPPTCKPTEHLVNGVCVPNEPPPPSTCPAECPANAKTIAAKCAQLNPTTGKCTTDSSPRCGDIGDGSAYCAAVTGDPSITRCKASPEGSGHDVGCNLLFLGAPCPIWQWALGPNGPWSRALPDGIDEEGNPREGGTQVSIDHLDGWSESDGPYTGRCQHATFGLHAPIAGFGGVPHGGPGAYVRSCSPDGLVCSNPVGPINY